MADLSTCIGSRYKSMLEDLIARSVAKETVLNVLGGLPLCDTGKEVAIAVAKAPGIRPTTWPAATYYNKDGSTKEGSFSGLFKEIYGESVLNDLVCSRGKEGVKCRALSVVENFRNRGDIVKGNGEDPPVPKAGMSNADVEDMYGKWKQKLIDKGLKIHIYHPEHPALKIAIEEVKKGKQGKVVKK